MIYNCNIKILTLPISIFCMSQTYGQYTNEISHKLEVEEEEIVLSIYNNSEDNEYYIFNSYFKSNYHNNKYLIKFDEAKKILKFSFLPLVNFIGTTLHSPLILTDEGIFKKNQNKYSFLELKPKKEVRIALNRKVICDTIINSNKFVIDYNPRDLLTNTTSFVKKDEIRLDEIKFEIAIYEQIDMLITEGSNFLNNRSFMELSNSYVTISFDSLLVSELCY